MYTDKVMDHFEHPRNVGELENPSGMGTVGNPKCGDIMRMYLKIENNVIVDVKFLTFGCGAAIATSSMATDLIKGTSPRLSTYTVTRRGEGLPITRRQGFKYLNLAPLFKGKTAEPFFVTMPYVKQNFTDSILMLLFAMTQVYILRNLI